MIRLRRRESNVGVGLIAVDNLIAVGECDASSNPGLAHKLSTWGSFDRK